MHVLCDIAMFYIHFHTLLIIFGITYYLSAPQCQFLFLLFFYFRFPRIKNAPKIPGKYNKNQRFESFQSPEGGPEGTHQGPRRPPGAA